MAIIPVNKYPGKIASADSEYPQGKARNVNTQNDGTGTPWEEALINDIWGFLQGLLNDAGITPSGNPDTVLASDYKDALDVSFVKKLPRSEFSSKNSGIISFTSGNGQTITQINLGNLNSGDRISITGLIQDMIIGSADASVRTIIAKISGTATIQFVSDIGQLRDEKMAKANGVASSVLTGELKIINAGTLTMTLSVVVTGTTATLQSGFGQMSTRLLNYA